MFFGRLERVTRTLRFRLAAWNVAALLGVLGLTLAGLHAGVRWTLLNELDQQLAEDAVEVGRMAGVERGPAELRAALDRKAESHTERGWFCQVFAPDGRLLSATKSAADLELPPPRAHRRARPTTTTVSNVRYGVWRVERPDADALVVRTGARLDSIEDDMWRLSRTTLAAVGVLAALVPLGGYWLAGRATRPLRAIVETAERLRPDHLDERLPVAGTGDELDHLARVVNNFLDRLGEDLGRRRDFLANAAHELRTPLAAMRAGVEVALERDLSAEECRDLLGDVVERVGSMGSLVNQLLLLAEGDAGQLRPGDELVELGKLAGRAADMFAGVAESRGVELTTDLAPGVLVRGQATHLRQVVQNVLDNALKYTPAGGRVGVVVRPGGPGVPATLEVSDTGQGIPAEDLPHVCERFYRVDRSRARGGPGGSGLGLSICTAIIGAYGGELRLASEPGRGTRVTVRLPAA